MTTTPYDPIPVGQSRVIDGKVYTSVILRKGVALPPWMGYRCAGCPESGRASADAFNAGQYGCRWALCGLNLSDPLRAPVIVPDHWVPLLALEGVLE